MQGKMNDISTLRKKIDKLDEQIIKMLRKRAELVKAIGKIKKTKNEKISDKERENEILEKMKNEYEKNIYKTIIKESKKLQ